MNNCKIRPRKNYIIVRERTAINEVRGIFMPDSVTSTSQNQMTEGEIISLGPLAFPGEQDDFPEGTIVKFIKYSGEALVYNGVFYRILLDDECIGKMDHYLELNEDLCS